VSLLRVSILQHGFDSLSSVLVLQAQQVLCDVWVLILKLLWEQKKRIYFLFCGEKMHKRQISARSVYMTNLFLIISVNLNSVHRLNGRVCEHKAFLDILESHGNPSSMK